MRQGEDMASPVVGILMGSASDRARMEGASEVLTQLEVPHEVLVLSAHRRPADVAAYADG
ncbi:MAG TPA: AIR carboxylase family protein, partial [Candidatus Eisenbacteria bacterium]|nr:AIR carboxylase family protein [Candidatus Eisenbacteria bacterium]